MQATVIGISLLLELFKIGRRIFLQISSTSTIPSLQQRLEGILNTISAG